MLCTDPARWLPSCGSSALCQPAALLNSIYTLLPLPCSCSSCQVDFSKFNLPPLDPAKLPKLPSLEQVRNEHMC
jgi:hypothetical protein